MYKAFQLLFFLLTMVFLSPSYAQNNGRLSGKVVDRTTQQPLAGISVSLQDSVRATMTDSSGIFSFSGLEVKSYSILFYRYGL